MLWRMVNLAAILFFQKSRPDLLVTAVSTTAVVDGMSAKRTKKKLAYDAWPRLSFESII